MSMFSDRPMLVPDFVGLACDEARALEHRFGVHIADPDPDAPPISNYWWSTRTWSSSRKHLRRVHGSTA